MCLYANHVLPFAVDGEDYTGGVYNVTFVGSNTATVPVPSIDDDTVEGVENFTAVIRVPSDTQRDHMVTRGSPDTAIVEINDNDSKCYQQTTAYSLGPEEHAGPYVHLLCLFESRGTLYDPYVVFVSI